jgi:hypothetical protein
MGNIMKKIRKSLAYVGCWVLICLAFAMLVILVGPFLVAALFIELGQGESVQATEALVSRERL